MDRRENTLCRIIKSKKREKKYCSINFQTFSSRKRTLLITAQQDFASLATHFQSCSSIWNTIDTLHLQNLHFQIAEREDILWKLAILKIFFSNFSCCFLALLRFPSVFSFPAHSFAEIMMTISCSWRFPIYISLDGVNKSKTQFE